MKKIIILIPLILLSCQKNDLTSLNSPLVANHTFSEVTQNDQYVVRPSSSACQRKDYYTGSFFSRLFDQNVNPIKHQKHILLVQGVIDHILNTNKDQVSEKSYKLGELCAVIYENKDINGFTLPGTYDDGLIYISSATIERAINLSDLAATIAHEMAHLTMNHHPDRHPYDLVDDQNFRDYYDAYFSFGKKLTQVAYEQKAILITVYEELINEEDIILKAALERIISKSSKGLKYNLQVQIPELSPLYLAKIFKERIIKYDELAAKNNLYQLRQRVLLKKMGHIANSHGKLHYMTAWRELEADEVGQELFIRAGFNPDFYSEREKRYAQTQAETLGVTCEDEDTFTVIGGTHPASCHRVLNDARERRLHKEEYSQFKMDEFPKLEKLLKEIKSELNPSNESNDKAQDSSVHLLQHTQSVPRLILTGPNS